MFGSRYMLTGPTYMPSAHIVLCAFNVEVKFSQLERWSYLYAHAHIAEILQYLLHNTLFTHCYRLRNILEKNILTTLNFRSTFAVTIEVSKYIYNEAKKFSGICYIVVRDHTQHILIIFCDNFRSFCNSY